MGQKTKKYLIVPKYNSFIPLTLLIKLIYDIF